jgi:hypothetical protein
MAKPADMETYVVFGVSALLGLAAVGMLALTVLCLLGLV